MFIRPRPNHSAFNSSSTTSDGSPPRPGPSRSYRSPTTPPLSTALAPHPQSHLSTRDASRRNSTIAVDIPDPPETGVIGEARTPRNTTGVDSHGRGVHPRAMDVDSDMGYRTAQARDRRTDIGSRVRDAGRNIVWEENHQSDDV